MILQGLDGAHRERDKAAAELAWERFAEECRGSGTGSVNFDPRFAFIRLRAAFGQALRAGATPRAIANMAKTWADGLDPPEVTGGG